jgi:hypothetical protein
MTDDTFSALAYQQVASARDAGAFSSAAMPASLLNLPKLRGLKFLSALSRPGPMNPLAGFELVAVRSAFGRLSRYFALRYRFNPDRAFCVFYVYCVPRFRYIIVHALPLFPALI